VIGGKNPRWKPRQLLARVPEPRSSTAARRRRVWYWLRPDLENRIGRGDPARLGSRSSKSLSGTSWCGALGNEERIPADRVYALIGFHPDFELFQRIGITYDPQSGRPEINPDTLETSVPGVYVAGSVTAGTRISEIFIENGRFDGEKIFGSSAERQQARTLYQGIRRETGE
jgi:hypothetical protein